MSTKGRAGEDSVAAIFPDALFQYNAAPLLGEEESGNEIFSFWYRQEGRTRFARLFAKRKVLNSSRQTGGWSQTVSVCCSPMHPEPFAKIFYSPSLQGTVDLYGVGECEPIEIVWCFLLEQAQRGIFCFIEDAL